MRSSGCTTQSLTQGLCTSSRFQTSLLTSFSAKMRHPVQRTLQDIACRDLIDHLFGRGHRAAQVGCGDTDGFLAEIEAEDGAEGGQDGGKIADVLDDHGAIPAVVAASSSAASAASSPAKAAVARA